VDVRKAIITAAGRGQRALPLQTLVDRDGTEKSALEIIIEEVVAAEVHEIGLIIAPGDAGAYAAAAGKHAARLSFLEQPEPRGYGHALSLARKFVGDGAFLHLVSDHLYVTDQPLRCAQQLVEQARHEGCSISAVQSTRETMLPYYGAVGGRRIPQRTDLYEVETVLEKPTPTEAEQSLIVPGLRAGHYLCFFGIHVFAPAIFDLLTQIVANTPAGVTVQLSPALARLAGRERYLALQVEGRRYNIGVKYGLLLAQLALAISGVERDHVLTQLLELLATRSQRGA
jgi:UTP--glucose-1-phosphate uridylyltransferase